MNTGHITTSAMLGLIVALAMPFSANADISIHPFDTDSSLTSTATATVSINPGSAVPGCENNDMYLTPTHLTITVGDTVIWTNTNSAASTVTSGTPFDGPDGFFDSALLLAGNSFSVLFPNQGVFPYFSLVHPWVQGSVTVVPVPEPSVAALLILGGLGITVCRRRF